MQIGFLPLLGIVFIVLKLCGVIAWSWLWVTAPLWSIPVLYIGFVLLMFIIAVLVELF